MKRTEAQILLGIHLAELGIEAVAEYQFCADIEGAIKRRWRFDLADVEHRIGFECNGHWQGRHGAAWSEGFEKLNFAQAYGWKVFVFHNRDVLTGKAKKFLEENLKS